jgi:DNA-binding NarL/FixJ family response regulator
VNELAKTVLVADDNPGVRKALCRLFEVEKDYEVCAEASNGEEVIALAKKHKPDLIILDLSMPGMHGLDAAAELKKIMPEIPIILFTVHAETFRNVVAKLPIDLIVSKGEFNLMGHVRRLVPVHKTSL